MICRLCLKDVQCIINIFDELGIELNVAEIVGKHFWFEPKQDDPISNAICEACWHKVTDFNEFYCSVEQAHRLLNERFSVNLKTNKERIPPRKVTKATSAKDDNDNAVSTSTTISPPIENENEMTIEMEEVVCNNNISDSTQQNANNISNDFDEQDEISTYLTLSDLDNLEQDEDALEEPAISPDVELNKRLTRAASKETIRTTRFGSTKLKLKSATADDADLPNKRRSRGRPKKNEANSSPATPPNSHKTPKRLSIKNEIQTSTTDESSKPSYKEKIRQGNERIAQFLRLNCDVCKEAQADFTLLCKHMASKHSQRGYLICCNKKFYKRVALLDHVDRHLNPELFRCKDCDRTFADKQCLKNHITIKHLPDESKTFACEICHKKFGKTYLLEQHQRTHKERSHICDACQKGFPSINQLKAHIKVIHNNYGTMCEICSKVIRGRAAFSRHMQQHEGVDLPKVQCPKCGSWHKDKYSLQKHIRRHNIDGTQHICNECGKVAPNRSALLAHKRFVHKAKRTYQCGICKKAFKVQITLKEHMATHTGQALYKCPHCSRTFNSNANMHSHRKKMHPKEFAEARMQRQRHTLYELEPQHRQLYEGKMSQQLQQQNETQVERQDNAQTTLQAVLTADEENACIDRVIDLDNEETHFLMTTNKFGELIFKVE